MDFFYGDVCPYGHISLEYGKEQHKHSSELVVHGRNKVKHVWNVMRATKLLHTFNFWVNKYCLILPHSSL